MYAPREKVPLLGLSIVMRGVCARAGGILTPISTWGEDVIVTASALRDKRPVSALTYAEIALLTRENFDEVLAGFPESARVIKNAAMKIAMQRAIVVVSAATKALKARQNNPQALAGRTPMMALLEGGATSNGAQLDVEAVIPLLTGKEVKTIEDLEGGGVGGEAGEEPGSPGRLGRDALKGVMSRLDAQEATQKALGAKLDKVLELLEKKA